YTDAVLAKRHAAESAARVRPCDARALGKYTWLRCCDQRLWEPNVVRPQSLADGQVEAHLDVQPGTGACITVENWPTLPIDHVHDGHRGDHHMIGLRYHFGERLRRHGRRHRQTRCEGCQEESASHHSDFPSSRSTPVALIFH